MRRIIITAVFAGALLLLVGGIVAVASVVAEITAPLPTPTTENPEHVKACVGLLSDASNPLASDYDRRIAQQEYALRCGDLVDPTKVATP